MVKVSSGLDALSRADAQIRHLFAYDQLEPDRMRRQFGLLVFTLAAAIPAVGRVPARHAQPSRSFLITYPQLPLTS